MSNPIYDMLKQAECQNDIADINGIVSVYERSRGRYLDLSRADSKIRELRGKDAVIFAMTEQKPGMSYTQWNCSAETQCYNILIAIRTYLEMKLANDIQKQQGGRR